MKQECKCGLECFKPFTFKSVRYLRYRYWTKSRQMRSQWLIQTLKNSKKNGKYTYMDVDSGERVCSVAFRLLYNINKNFLVKCNKNARRNAVASDVKKAKGMTVKSVMCVGWIENYVTACADRMPDKGAILLPYKTRKSNVYNIYKSENTEPVSKSTFQYLWRHHFPQVKVKQVRYSI